MAAMLQTIMWTIRFFSGFCTFGLLNVLIEHRYQKGQMVWKYGQLRSFMISVVGGIVFVGCGIQYDCSTYGILSLRGMVIFMYLGILLVVALIDWKLQIIYDRFHIFILLLGVFSIWLFPEHGIGNRLIGSLIVSIPMLLLAMVIPGAFGGGDIKLMAVSGWMLGVESIICAMFLGLFAGGCYGSLMVKKNKLGRKDQFALGPFLALGLTIAVFYGDQIMS